MHAQKLAVVIFILTSLQGRPGDGSPVSITVDQKISTVSCDWSGGGTSCQCNSLQRVLSFIANTTNSTNSGNDSNLVDVQIAGGRYELTDPVTIEQNIILRAKTPGVVVTVNLEKQRLSCNDSSISCHGLLIRNVEHVTIEGIKFEKSEGIITFENVSGVTVSNSEFRYFMNGALDMFMCFQVVVSNCTFEDNGPVTVFKQEQYRGSAAGISIGYDDNHYSDTGTPIDAVPGGTGSVTVTNCTFQNNTHTPITDQQVNTHNFFSRYVFPGRGGALSVTVNSSFPFNANITDCLVENNLAQSFGGGFYIVYSGYSEHLTVVNNSRFANGHAQDGGGGALVVAFVEAGRRESFNVRLEIYNTNFADNSAIFGGGIYFLAGRGTTRSGELTNHIRMENCSFSENRAIEYGAALCVSSLLFLQPTFNIPPIIIKNSTFDNNDALGRGGVLSTAYVPIYFGGYINFHHNRGRSLAVIGTRVEVHGDILFYGNGGSGIDGGSVYLTSFAQLVLQSGARMDFINNTGVLGAALVADYHIQSSISRTYLQTIYNPLCPVRYEDTTLKPDNWSDISITFEGNQALVGSAVFLDGIHACAWTGQHSVSELDPGRAFRWNFIKFGINTNTVHGEEEDSVEWYVQTPAESIGIMNNNVTAFLGEDFDLDVYGLDELGQLTAVALTLSDANDPSDITFIPETVVPGKQRDVLVHSRFLSSSGSYRILGKQRQILISSILTTNVIQEYFLITPEVCPAGYQLTVGSLGYECVCNSENDTRVASCQGRRILLTSKLRARH